MPNLHYFQYTVHVDDVDLEVQPLQAKHVTEETLQGKQYVLLLLNELE